MPHKTPSVTAALRRQQGFVFTLRLPLGESCHGLAVTEGVIIADRGDKEVKKTGGLRAASRFLI